MIMIFTNVLENLITVGMQAGSGTPLYFMGQKRLETEVTKLSQNNPFFTVWGSGWEQLLFTTID